MIGIADNRPMARRRRPPRTCTGARGATPFTPHPEQAAPAPPDALLPPPRRIRPLLLVLHSSDRSASGYGHGAITGHSPYRELAAAAGVTVQTIQKWEAPDPPHNPHPRTLRKFAEALKIEPNELY